MNPAFRNSLAIIIGAMIGGAVNMGIILISGHIIPPPAGADLTTEAGLKAAMQLMEPKHFLMPFLAHAIGTLAGAIITALLAVSHKKWFALAIGIFFLAGGVMEVISLPSPVWFTITDLVLAYIPMAFLGAKLADKKK